MSNDYPPLLNRLRDELRYKVRLGRPSLGYSVFRVDLSAYRLSLSDVTPVVWVKKEQLHTLSTQHLLDSLHDVVRERNLRRDPILVLLEGDGSPLRSYTQSVLEGNRIVVIGADEQAAMLASSPGRVSGELRDLITAQIPISLLAPYETAAPVMGSRFFGRETEIKRIVYGPPTNHVILGIRRIGKTSLLKEVERRLREDDPDPDARHIVYLDCSDLFSPDDYIQEVVRKLNPKELPRLSMKNYAFFFPDFLERMSRMYRRKILFLLDEIDNLIIAQRGTWDLFRMLRASSNKDMCQYIVAGFRDAMQEQATLDSPFYNFGQDIRLTEFKLNTARELIVLPMEQLGVTFRQKDEVVQRIYHETAGHPNLIQYYCTLLLRKLDEPGTPRVISLNSLIDVYQDQGFQDYLLTSFMLNTNNRDKLLVFSLLLSEEGRQLEAFTQIRLDEVLRKLGVNLRQNDLDEACRVLKLAGIFSQLGKNYYFTSPVFTKVLQQSYDLNYLISKTIEEGL